jgi:hypothetical protein
MGFDSHGRSNYGMHAGSFRAQGVEHVHAKEHAVAIQSRKEFGMKSKNNLWIAGLAAFLLGVPLAEKAAAQSSGDIVSASLGLLFTIIGAAGSAS